MLMADPELEATFPGTPPGVGELRHAAAEIARRAGMGETAVDAVRLAASEAASNAVIHAYREHHGELRLRATIEDGELQLVIADEGVGLAPRTDSPGLGLGLPIMARISERFEIVSGPGGTEIHLAFRCEPAG
jgi:serine/threonine-protein kinase RsbW/stage II sporulation protein AB (anti-sigma F factor)